MWPLTATAGPPHIARPTHPPTRPCHRHAQIYNPGLREAIKTYSAWPTIPQVTRRGDALPAPLPAMSPVTCPARSKVKGPSAGPCAAAAGAPTMCACSSPLWPPPPPQIYIGGEFVGGADIFVQMHGSGGRQGRVDAWG